MQTRNMISPASARSDATLKLVSQLHRRSPARGNDSGTSSTHSSPLVVDWVGGGCHDIFESGGECCGRRQTAAFLSEPLTAAGLSDAQSNDTTVPNSGSIGPSKGAVSGGRRDEKDERTAFPFVMLLMAFVFPVMGCFGFCMCLHSKENTPRARWARRALYVGSALSFLYSFAIACIVSHFVTGVGVDGH